MRYVSVEFIFYMDDSKSIAVSIFQEPVMIFSYTNSAHREGGKESKPSSRNVSLHCIF